MQSRNPALVQIENLIVQFKADIDEIETISESINVTLQELSLLKTEIPALSAEIIQLESDLDNLKIQGIGTKMSREQKIVEAKQQKESLLVEVNHLQQLFDQKAEVERQLRAVRGQLETSHKLIENAPFVYMLKGTSKDPFSTSGTGIEFAISDMPRGEEQAESILKALNDVNEKIYYQEPKVDRGMGVVFDFARAQAEWPQKHDAKLTQTHQSLKEIAEKIKDLKKMKDIYSEDSFRGAIARGDCSSIPDYLTKMRLNKSDAEGHKPIYYAARFGNLNALELLLDCTVLTKAEKAELLNIFPTSNQEKYSLAVSKIKNSEHAYDHLWNSKLCIGDNFRNVLKDYYSPKILESFDILSAELKRILTLNWNRLTKDLDFAEKAVTVLSLISDEERQDEKLCKRIFKGRWKEYFLNESLNSENELARRLHYLNLKFFGRPALAPSASFASSSHGFMSPQSTSADPDNNRLQSLKPETRPTFLSKK